MEFEVYVFSGKDLFAPQMVSGEVCVEENPNSSHYQWDLELHFIASNCELHTTEIWTILFTVLFTLCLFDKKIQKTYTSPLVTIMSWTFSCMLFPPYFLHSQMKRFKYTKAGQHCHLLTYKLQIISSLTEQSPSPCWLQLHKN